MRRLLTHTFNRMFTLQQRVTNYCNSRLCNSLNLLLVFKYQSNYITKGGQLLESQCTKKMEKGLTVDSEFCLGRALCCV